MSIRAQLINLINETIPDSSFVGEVVAVDETQFTCDIKPLDDSPVFHDVRLKSLVDNDSNGVVQIPAIGSNVIASCINNNKDVYFVSRFSKVTKWHVFVEGGGKMEIDDVGNIKLNGGLLGGLPLINPLKTELTRLNTNMTILKSAAASAMATLSGLLDGGATASAFNTAIATMTPQNLTALENNKVQQ